MAASPQPPSACNGGNPGGLIAASGMKIGTTPWFSSSWSTDIRTVGHCTRLTYWTTISVMSIHNPSAPPNSVTPVLAYDDVRAAVDWLTHVVGFTERVRIDDHRSQLAFGDGAVIVADASHGRGPLQPDAAVTHSVLVRVHDIDAHHRTLKGAGANVRSEPTDLPFGERQYSVVDPGGHSWTFTESIAQLRPEDWGGDTVTEW